MRERMQLFSLCITLQYVSDYFSEGMSTWQIEALKIELEQFFGKDPMNSKDISRIVSSTQFKRLAKLLDEDKVSDKIVLGGQMDENQLWVTMTFLAC